MSEVHDIIVFAPKQLFEKQLHFENIDRQTMTKSIWTDIFTAKLVVLCMISLSVAKASKNSSLFLNGSSETTIQCSLPFGKGSSGGENLAGLTPTNIEIKSFPFLASYGYYAKPRHETWNHVCTASILSKNALLTAAHCLRLLEEI